MSNTRIAPGDSLDPFAAADAGFQTADKSREKKNLMLSPGDSIDPDAIGDRSPNNM